MKKARIFIILFIALIFISILSACQNKNEYKITFDSNGGSIVYSMETDGNSIVNLPSDPSKEGYSFKGWYLDNETFENSFKNDSLLYNPINSDFTLYAKWKKQSYRVNFYANGGLLISGEKRQTVMYGDTVMAPVLEKEGYEFIGWDKEFTNITANISVFALYSPKEFTITLDKQGGSGGPSSFDIDYDGILPELAVPTKANNNFGGYYTAPNGKGKKYYDQDMRCVNSWDIESDTTLYAKWYQEITFDKQGGRQGDDRAEAVIGQDMPQCQAPILKGHTFLGYFSQEDGQGTQYYNADMESVQEWNSTTDMTLYAYWAVNDYTISFDKQGGIDGINEVIVTYNQDMPACDAPQKSGYVFQGYYSQPYGIGEPYYDKNMDSVKVFENDEDITLYAYWTLRQGTNGLNYELIYDGNVSTNKYKVIGYSGTATKVFVPVIHNGKSVTQIADDAFYRCVNIEEMIIPDTITSIGKNAFYECVSMTTIELSQATLTIGDYAFYHCVALTEVTIPDSVKSIGKAAFLGCGNLESIVLGEGLSYIEENVFENCINLNNIVLSDNIVGIGKQAFSNNLSLSNITLSQNLTIIGEYAFENCSALTEIVLPNNLTSLGDRAFYSCENLNSIHLPVNIKYIGKDATLNCNLLESLTILATSPPALGGAIIPSENLTIFVPLESVIVYKNAWSSIADIIQAIIE